MQPECIEGCWAVHWRHTDAISQTGIGFTRKMPSVDGIKREERRSVWCRWSRHLYGSGSWLDVEESLSLKWQHDALAAISNLCIGFIKPPLTTFLLCCLGSGFFSSDLIIYLLLHPFVFISCKYWLNCQ